MMANLLIIGAGGVGSVITQKCAAHPEIFPRICLASRTLRKCEKIRNRLSRSIDIRQVDAEDPAQVCALIRECQADLVIHAALPYQDLSIMDACIEAGAHYLDTANYEAPDKPGFSYEKQWERQPGFHDRNRMALLGSGFDPGVTNVFCAYAARHLYDRIRTIDIIDCNAAENGLPFATNFNPEINIREVTAPGRYREKGKWVTTEPLAITQTIDFPEGIGPRKVYLMYHEEMESLSRHYPEIERMRFWMTFSDDYLTHLRVLQNVGMTAIHPVTFEGQKIVPLKFLKALLPDPADLGSVTCGKTCIGCRFDGEKDGVRRQFYLYNICSHEACFQELGVQAVAYTTGVPAFIGASLMATGTWTGKGVFNMEQFDPLPFMNLLNQHGLPWTLKEI